MKPTTPEAYKLFHDGTLALSRMEAHGINIHTERLAETIVSVSEQIDVIAKKLQDSPEWEAWRKRFGMNAELGKRQQLGILLFDVLGHTYPYEKKGDYTVDEKVMSTLNLDFCDLYVRMQKLLKLRSTYLIGIQSHITPDGLVHGTYSLTIPITYRSSAFDPNWQNVPIRDPEIGKLIRRCIIPREEHQLIEVDFKGAEVCVAACYHKDQRMLRYIRDGYDMHVGSAMHCFLIEKADVTKELRQHAKGAFTFAAFYGDWYKSMAVGLWGLIEKHGLKTKQGIPMLDHLRSRGIGRRGLCSPKGDTQEGTYEHTIQKAEHWLWKEEFTQYDKWKKDWYAEYQKNGSFHTLTGFTLHGPFSKNDACNYPVQGSAFHCLLWCLIEMTKEIAKQRKKTKLVAQIHDSILADVPTEEVDWYLATLNDIITCRLPEAWKWIITPMIAEAEVVPVGGSWFDKKEVSLGIATPPRAIATPACVACAGSGTSTSGKPCSPCNGTGIKIP